MINILVTGSNGQLGKSIKDMEHKHSNFNFIFTDYQELDISDFNSVENFFKNNSIDFCINCAAYTAVDQAENNPEDAYQINELGVKNLATVIKNNQTILIHISTDFVFDGTKKEPYTEADSTNPLNVYGDSKLKGETHIQTILTNYFIIRTSWLYSEHGNNFVKTMLRLASEKNEIQVVNDQIGSPTYAKDLAEFILWIISENINDYGLYHYCNSGSISWYEFTLNIFKILNIHTKVIPTSSSKYKTLATRPLYSVLSTKKTEEVFNLKPKPFLTSLNNCLKHL